MQTRELRERLRRIDGRSYPAYKDIKGRYDFAFFTLFIDHVQGDPFAAPSRFRVRVPAAEAVFPPETFSNRSRAVALRDFLARKFAHEARRASDRLGSGKSGLIAMDMPGQEILERSSILVDSEGVEARFVVGLPAQGRRVLGRRAETMICDSVARIVEKALLYRNLRAAELDRHIRTAEPDIDIGGGKPGILCDNTHI